MTKLELEKEIVGLAERCDDSREQQAIKSVLYGLLGAIASNRERELMNHSVLFSENEVRRLTASRN